MLKQAAARVSGENKRLQMRVRVPAIILGFRSSAQHLLFHTGQQRECESVRRMRIRAVHSSVRV